jgi:hypothetical protein
MKKATKTPEKTKAFDYKTIKTFEDACKATGNSPLIVDILSGLPPEFVGATIAVLKLFIIFKAINDGWTPDWGNGRQLKYYPWFWVLSSGFGFVGSYYDYSGTDAYSGSRLCTDTSEKAKYIAKTFEAEYKEFLLIQK